MKRKVRILIADDHALIRSGIASVVQFERDLEVVGEAEDGEEAVRQVGSLKPDVVVMDLLMPTLDGVSAIGRLVQEAPAAHVLALTSSCDPAEVRRAVVAGARGVVFKDEPNERIIEAVRVLAAGGEFFSERARRFLSDAEAEEALSARQVEILDLSMRGFNTNDIACRFGMSASGVKKHFIRIFAKLGAATRTEAVAVALRKHILKT